MGRDVDALRRLLLELEKEQRSPPESIFLPVEDFARMIDASVAETRAALDLLAELDFIEGPGAYRDREWLFRKLTRRGVQLVDAIRDAEHWRKVKDVYGVLLEP